MRKIQKILSLEPMTSRLPSVLPAYYEDKLYYFDDISLRLRKYLKTSNWGMVPVNIRLLSRPNDNNNILSGNGEFIISFYTLSNWYHFFTNYYNLLNNSGNCGRSYSSATDYFDIESRVRRSSPLPYGNDRATYEEMDRFFLDEVGGKVQEIKENGRTYYRDEGFFKWICENIVPTFIIPTCYAESWKSNVLFYPDVIREITWFGKRLGYEDDAHFEIDERTSAETWNCKNENVDDCCDCEEYFKKGGKRIYDKMIEWYNSVQEKLNSINNEIKDNIDKFIPTIISQVNFQNSIEDLGEFSIFSKDYKLGEDYRTVKTTSNDESTSIDYDSGNTHSGTVVTISGNSMILQGDGPGFDYDTVLMKKIYDEDAFSSYTEHYINEHEGEFVVSSFTKYAFTYDGRKVVWNDDRKLHEMFGEVYDVLPKDSMYIDGNLYDIERSEYGVYNLNDRLSGNTYLVYRDEVTLTPYTIINSKRMYGTLYYSGTTPVFYFVFFKNEGAENRDKYGCKDKPVGFNINDYVIYEKYKISDDTKEYIMYNNLPYFIEDHDTIPSISGDVTDYDLIFRVDGTFQDRFGKNYYCSGGTIYKEYDNGFQLDKIDTTEYVSGATRISGTTTQNNPSSLARWDDYWYCTQDTLICKDSGGSFCILYNNVTDIETYDVTILTGTTISKIYKLRSRSLLTDDIGNTIEGTYNIRPNYNVTSITSGNVKTFYQPPSYTSVEPMYQVGNTANISRFKMTVQDEDKIVSGTNYFVGDIIESMEFYYVDMHGNKVVETSVSAGTTACPSSLSAIKQSTSLKKAIESGDSLIILSDDIRCDITYYIGATLSRKKGEPYVLAEGFNHGIKYTETVKFPRTETKYYLKKFRRKVIPTKESEPENNDVFQIIYTYPLVQEQTTINSKLYNTSYDVALANFEAVLNINDEYKTNNWSDMSERNNLEAFPTFREEYKMGISINESVDSDIYIDRGINAAFEKHMKLGEVASLEALEQYGGSFFTFKSD